ncbi:MAG: peptide chain release factor 1 [Bacteroides sp.]|nr:MAG: peptide chain release factor 1 [Bacteroides sp.]
MLEKEILFKKRIKEIEKELLNFHDFNNINKYKDLNKEHKYISTILIEFDSYKEILNSINSNNDILKIESDKEILNMVHEEIKNLYNLKKNQEATIYKYLIPNDVNDSKNVILEIRSGTGGDEAALFAGVLYRAYIKYAEINKWKVEVLNKTEGTQGGYKEIIVNISGNEVYQNLKFESGVHRVQRVPTTDTQGRIHTSAASIAVLPEPENIDVKIKDSDLRKDTFCSSGPGGQSVNTTYSAIRLVHIPTGITVQCQDEKSQIKNYDKALKVLKARIYEKQIKEQKLQISSARKNMILNGDRSEKIRTYNFPQNRVTDHRINLIFYNINHILNGHFFDLIKELQLYNNKLIFNAQMAK